MNYRNKNLSTIALLSILSLFLVYSSGDAKVTGNCVNCHTMHNSQNGTEVATPGPAPSETTPHKFLLVQACLGCHTGTNTADNTTPYVHSLSEPTFGTNTMAGGNFYWVKNVNDAKGHNVFYNEGDDNLSEAPGNAVGTCGTNACHHNLHLPYSGPDMGEGLPGKYGCEGCHLIVKHHANDGTGTKYVGTAAKGWYRFVSGHLFTGKGAKGIEHERWNYSATADSHNEYLGGAATATGFGFIQSGGAGAGVTALCTGCHGNFCPGGQKSGGQWIRHPSDSVIPNSGEYSAISTTYNPNVPVARPEAFLNILGNTPDSTVQAGRDMVMCLSCHVAHGSPYDDLLRWNYEDMIAGGGGSGGCFTCHTQKNQTP